MKHLLFLLLLSASILAPADQVALRVCPPLEMPPVNTKERPKNRPVIYDLPELHPLIITNVILEKWGCDPLIVPAGGAKERPFSLPGVTPLTGTNSLLAQWPKPQGQYMNSLRKQILAADANGDTAERDRLFSIYRTWADKYLLQAKPSTTNH